MSEKFLQDLQKSIEILADKISAEKKPDEQLKLSQQNKQVNEVLTNLINLLKNGLVYDRSKKGELWNIIVNALEGRPALEFIKMKCAFIQLEDQRLLLWVLLELAERSLCNCIEHISQSVLVRDSYEEGSCFRLFFPQIINQLKNVEGIQYKIDGRLPIFYTGFLSEKKLSSIFTPSNPIDNRSLLACQEEKSVSSVSSVSENTTNDSKNTSSIEKKQDNIEEIKNTTNDQISNLATTRIQPSAQPPKTPPTQALILTPAEPTKQRKQTDFSLQQQQPQQSQQQQPQQSPQQQPQLPLSPSSQAFNSSIDLNTILGLHGQRSSNALFSKFNGQKQTLTGSDSNAHLLIGIHKDNQDENTKQASRIRPSAKLFDGKFSNIQEAFPPKYKEPATLESQNHLCHECSAKISKGLIIIGNNAYFCYHTGYWYCYDCIAQDKKPIWWKALQNFDLTSYKVSKKAQKEIEHLYNYPILRFEYDSDLVNQNQILYEFMILKRQIYLLYDVLCVPEYLETYLKPYMNLCVKPNIFSLKNFYDINNGSLTKVLEDTYKLFIQHIEGCDKCIKKGKDCSLCNKGPKLYVFDLKNTALCDKCNEMYHRQCLLQEDCQKCHHDN